MAYSDDTTLPRDTVVLISESGTDISAARFQNIGQSTIKIMATATESAPDINTGFEGAIYMPPFEIIGSDKTLAQLFPSVTTPVRLYATSASLDGKVSINHA